MTHPYFPIRDDEDKCWAPIEPDVVEQDNPVIATFLDVDGDPLIVVRERRTVAFGYQKD